jgi:hypothetical protein
MKTHTVFRNDVYKIVAHIPASYYEDNEYYIYVKKDGEFVQIKKKFSTIDRAQLHAMEFVDFERKQDPMENVRL